MCIYGNEWAKRSVDQVQLSICCLERVGARHRTLGTGVHQRDRSFNLNARQSAQPCNSLFSQHGASRRRHLTDRHPKGGRRRRLARKLFQRLGPEKHFIRIADHTLPAEIANAIDNLHGARTGSLRDHRRAESSRERFGADRPGLLQTPFRFPCMSDTIAIRIKDQKISDQALTLETGLTSLESWRRGWESNPRMEVLQTSPLGHLGTAPRSISITKTCMPL